MILVNIILKQYDEKRVLRSLIVIDRHQEKQIVLHSVRVSASSTCMLFRDPMALTSAWSALYTHGKTCTLTYLHIHPSCLPIVVKSEKVRRYTDTSSPPPSLFTFPVPAIHHHRTSLPSFNEETMERYFIFYPAKLLSPCKQTAI